MKLILAILALSIFAITMADNRFKKYRAHGIQQQIAATCPGRCVMQDKYRKWVMQAAPKLREFLKQLYESSQPPVIPTLHPEKWDQYCTEIESVRTCMNNCNDPDEADKKAKASAILNAAHDIVCDQEIKMKFQCLQEVVLVSSPICYQQCLQYSQPIVDAYNQYRTTGQVPAESERWERAKNLSKNACLYANCRLKCLKADIEQKCQAKGFHAAKKFLKEVAILVQTSHNQFRPPQNFPEECKPHAIIADL